MFWLVLFCLFSLAALAGGDNQRVIRAMDLNAIGWRSIGPANMGGRVAALALVPGSTTEFYVGYATGGLFKTNNQGTTFSEVFRDQETSSIGAVAVANVTPDWPGWDVLAAHGDTVAAEDRSEKGRGRVVWVGTGEGNGRNSSSWGHGVYRSTDGGGSFAYVGLAETQNIPRLAVDPRNPEVCYVAAMGHLWGANPERGLYKTSDGGQSWQHIIKIDDQVGACDVVVDPTNPDRVFAALYAARRTPWSFNGFSDKAGIWRSDDAGATWMRLTNGLPQRTGRIGLALFAGNTDIIYATVESDQGGIGRSAWDDRSPAGGLFRSDDGGQTWRRVNELNFRPFYFSRVAVDPVNPERVIMPGWDVAVSEDGGRSFRRNGSTEVHVDHHAIVVCPEDPNLILLGNDGGLYISHDGTKTWDFLNNLAVGQFYHVDVDMSTPFRVGGGLQDNGSWVGPAAVKFKSGSDAKPFILNEDWTAVYSGDGFKVAFDPTDENIIYATSQDGNLGRVDLRTMLTRPLKPAADEGQTKLRWNWDAPFLISSHDPSVLYHAGNKVFKLTSGGDFWYAISGDLTKREPDKIMTEGSAAEAYGTLSALAESPVEPGVLWAGSDDGLIHVTFDDGEHWRDVTPKQVGGLYIAHLEASHQDRNTAYCAVDGHRSDNFQPLILMTKNGGRKWRDITGDLPAGGPVRVVREDPDNPSVLYCGTEYAAYVSFDRGAHWLKPGGESLPTVPVYDLKIQPREHSLVAATHGRSLWIMDGMGALAELPKVADEPLHLFPVPDAEPHLYGFRGYGGGNRVFRGAPPVDGAVITYWLRDMPTGSVDIIIKDESGQKVRKLKGSVRPGLNRVAWDLQADPKRRFADPRQTGPVFVDPGLYTVAISSGDDKAEAVFTVRPHPGWVAPEDKAMLPPPQP